MELILYGSPIDISKSLVKDFFKKVDYCILTSATLRVDDSFDYYFTRTGLNYLGVENVISGVFKGLGENGSAIIKTNQSEQEFHSGEVY